MNSKIPSLILSGSLLPLTYFSKTTGTASSCIPWNGWQKRSAACPTNWGFIESDLPMTCANPSWGDVAQDIELILNLSQSLKTSSLMATNLYVLTKFGDNFWRNAMTIFLSHFASVCGKPIICYKKKKMLSRCESWTRKTIHCELLWRSIGPESKSTGWRHLYHRPIFRNSQSSSTFRWTLVNEVMQWLCQQTPTQPKNFRIHWEKTRHNWNRVLRPGHLGWAMPETVSLDKYTTAMETAARIQGKA